MSGYEIRHRTRYGYADEVTASYGRAYLIPRAAPGQRCTMSRLDVDPAPLRAVRGTDFYGNPTVYFEVHEPHTVLDVRAVSRVEVTRAVPDLTALTVPWERAVDLVGAGLVTQVAASAGVDPGAGLDVVAAREMLLASPQVGIDDAVAAYAASVFGPGRPLGEALTALVAGIHHDFEYRSGATDVTTTLAEVLDRREGVCQDFAHLAVGCLRAVGLPARYVSGYLETRPPPGRPKLQGADASHAWVSTLVPGVGWVDLDPTNNQPADDRYVVTAWGRDYTDVPPLKGVIFTESTGSELTVEVDVVPVDPGR